MIPIRRSTAFAKKEIFRLTLRAVPPPTPSYLFPACPARTDDEDGRQQGLPTELVAKSSGGHLLKRPELPVEISQ